MARRAYAGKLKARRVPPIRSSIKMKATPTSAAIRYRTPGLSTRINRRPPKDQLLIFAGGNLAWPFRVAVGQMRGERILAYFNRVTFVANGDLLVGLISRITASHRREQKHQAKCQA